MHKKIVNTRQLELFDDYPASFPSPAAPASRLDPVAPAEPPFSATLGDQVARDEQTLRLGPNWWVPSREFFEERIASYRAYALTLQS